MGSVGTKFNFVSTDVGRLWQNPFLIIFGTLVVRPITPLETPMEKYSKFTPKWKPLILAMHNTHGKGNSSLSIECR